MTLSMRCATIPLRLSGPSPHGDTTAEAWERHGRRKGRSAPPPTQSRKKGAKGPLCPRSGRRRQRMDIYRPAIGTPIAELETPCLLVDLDAAEHNLQVVADTYRDTTCKMRSHVKNLKTPVLAHMQMRAGGTIDGVCAAKVAEAEVMVEGGITDVLIANQVVGRDKIARLCALARRANLKVAIDDARNLRELSRAAQAHGVTLGVVIEVDTSMHRAGIRQVA